MKPIARRSPKNSTILGWLTLLIFASQIAWAATMSEVTSQLICTCGCTMIVSDCNCGTADDIRNLVQAKIDQGMGTEAILQDFVSQYGEKVLAAPTKRGFNLTAWVLPFVALLGAGVAVTFILRGWIRSEDTPAQPSPISDAIQDAQARERLKRELEEFDA